MGSTFYILHNLNDDDEQEMIEVDREEFEELLSILFDLSLED